jgi:hypothetical protein
MSRCRGRLATASHTTRVPSARATACVALMLQLAACGSEVASELTTTSSQSRSVAEVAPASALDSAPVSTLFPAAPDALPAADRMKNAAPPSATELRLTRGTVAYRDPVSLQGLPSSGYPKVSAVVYRMNAEDGPLAVPVAASCLSAIRCELRAPGAAASVAPLWELAIDKPSFATLIAGDGGVVVMPASNAFETDAVVTLTLTSSSGTLISRRIRYTARQ